MLRRRLTTLIIALALMASFAPSLSAAPPDETATPWWSQLIALDLFAWLAPARDDKRERDHEAHRPDDRGPDQDHEDDRGPHLDPDG